VSDSHDWLRRAVADVLRRPIVECAVRPGTYRSSWDLCEVDVQLSGGERVALVAKRFDATCHPVATVRPAFLVDPTREIGVYRDILGGLDAGTAKFYGNTVDPDGHPVLVLERVDGTPLWQIGDFSKWLAAARWLGHAHSRLAGMLPKKTPVPFYKGTGVFFEGMSQVGALIYYDEAYYRTWPGRAGLNLPIGNYDVVVALLKALPHTIIHGEFHASNVVVCESGRLCVLDWEMAAIGPGFMDLADLTSGKWSVDERRALVDAYRGACDAAMGLSDSQFAAGLAACRLHRALQWLGWSDNWTPPPEHATDWLAEANEAWHELGG
jgi:hypothetical protein